MNREEMLGAIKKIQGWKIAADFSVGGLEWIAFSKRCPSMLVVISSQKSTMVDGKTGKTSRITGSTLVALAMMTTVLCFLTTVELSFYNGLMTCDGSESCDAKNVSLVK